MKRLWAWLNDPEVAPGTQTCRIKVWAHDNAFTMVWFSGMNIVGWALTVWLCH